MKINIFKILFIQFFCFLNFTFILYSNNNSTISIETKNTNIDLGFIILNRNRTKISDKSTSIKNLSSVPIDLNLKIIEKPSLWNITTSYPTNEEFRLFGIFHQKNKTIYSNDFEIDDLITTNFKIASDKIFAILNEDKKYKGYNILPNNEVNLFYRFDAPSKTQLTNQDIKIKILIKATIHPILVEEIKKPTQTLITPNGDGINDVLKFPGLANYEKEFKITILDLTGRVVKEIVNKDEWDGTDNYGSKVKSGIYIYQYKIENKFICGFIAVAR